MNSDKWDIYSSKLKTIAKLVPKEKLIYKDNSIEVVDYSTFNYARFKKLFMHGNRKIIIRKLKQFYRDIDDTVDSLHVHKKGSPYNKDLKIKLDNLYDDLKNSIKGMKNQCITYNEDKTAKAELETIIEKISQTLDKIVTVISDIDDTSKSFSTSSDKSV